MPETLLSPSNVLLYGRVLLDLEFVFRNPDEQGPDQLCPPPRRLGANNFLQGQLEADDNNPPRMARIYGFSYEGHYYDLAKPAIFLVHGPGDDPEEPRPGLALPDNRVDRAPADADRTGVAYTSRSFSHDMRVWTYDKGDFSIRLDPMTGTFDQILLEGELRADRIQSQYSGDKLRIRPNRGGNMGD